MRINKFTVALCALCAVCFRMQAEAGPVFDHIKEKKELKVCIWPDYYGVTFRSPRDHNLRGIDIDLSQVLAKKLDAKLVYVDSSFPTLIPDLLSGKCDIAMFAIGVLPQRSEKLNFTHPYLKSDIYAITTKSNVMVRSWSDIDKPGVIIGVQEGTFMEPVMRAHVKLASVVAIAPPLTREKELQSGRIDVFMTDFPYSRRLLDNADWARLVEPPEKFYELPYAYAVRPGDNQWLSYLNDFVKEIKSNGTLTKAAINNGLQQIVVK